MFIFPILDTNLLKKGGVPTDRRYGYYVKRVEGLPFPTAEAQARLTNNRKRPGLSGHVMPAPASIPSGGTGFEPQSYAHGQVMQGHQQGNLLKGIGGFQLLDLIITELKSHMTC